MGNSPHDRFKRFAEAILAVPKSEIMALVKKVLSELKSKKQKIDSKVLGVRRELADRKNCIE